MKTKGLFSLFIFSLICAVSFTACSSSNDKNDDVIWDFAPIVISIAVQDANGNDLLNPDTPGNIAKQGIKAIHRGMTYLKDEPVSQTRAINIIFSGLQTMKLESGKYILTFGQFAGDNAYADERILIDWNDGSKDIITFSSKLTWDSKDEPVFDRSFCLNGKEIKEDYPLFTFTKKPAIESLKVAKYSFIHTRYVIDADNKEKIEADIKNNPSYPEGSAFSLSPTENPDESMYVLFDVNNSPLLSGKLTITKATGIITPEISAIYKPLPPTNQINAYMQWKVTLDNKEHTYDVFIVQPSNTRMDRPIVYDLWTYENLTTYYQAKYPDSNIKAVVRVQASKYNSIKK